MPKILKTSETLIIFDVGSLQGKRCPKLLNSLMPETHYLTPQTLKKADWNSQWLECPKFSQNLIPKTFKKREVQKFHRIWCSKLLKILTPETLITWSPKSDALLKKVTPEIFDLTPETLCFTHEILKDLDNRNSYRIRYRNSQLGIRKSKGTPTEIDVRNSQRTETPKFLKNRPIET